MINYVLSIKMFVFCIMHYILKIVIYIYIERSFANVSKLKVLFMMQMSSKLHARKGKKQHPKNQI
jgi:hypothetical protein